MTTEPKKGHYYYMANGQCVILEDFATRPDGTDVFIVIPYYEGEAIKASGDGGYHHEITCEYIHEGLPILVDQLFKKAPTEKLCQHYAEKLKQIENLSLAAGMVKEATVEAETHKRKIMFETKQYEIEHSQLSNALTRLKERYEESVSAVDKKRQELSELEDTIQRIAKVPNDVILVDKEELKQLRKTEYKMQCLEGFGIDSWEWYDDSLKEYYERYPEN